MSRYNGVLLELNKLHAVLKTILSNANGDVPSALFSRCESIARRGLAFSILMNDPSNLPSASLPEDPLKEVVHRSLEALKLWNIAFQKRSNHSLYRIPVNFDHIFLWIDFVHPMHHKPRHRVGMLTLGDSLYVTIAGLIHSMHGKNTKLDLHEYLVANPRAVYLMLDLWVHFPRYSLQSPALDLVRDGLLPLSYCVWSLCLRSSTDPRASAVLGSELVRTTRGNSRTLLRCLGTHARYLTTMSASDTPDMSYAVYFQILTVVCKLAGASGPPAPGSFFMDTIEAARECIRRGNDAAVGDPRNVVLAIKAGLLDVLLHSRTSQKPSDGSVDELVHCIRSNLVLPSVLRALHSEHGEELLDNGDTILPIQGRFPKLVQTYRDRWEETHETSLRACPCAQAFYCSVRCQRQHWRATHRLTCGCDNGPLELGEAVVLSDVLGIIRTVGVLLHVDRAAVAKEVRWVVENRVKFIPLDYEWINATMAARSEGRPLPERPPPRSFAAYIFVDLTKPVPRRRKLFDWEVGVRETPTKTDPDL
ncbi:hypothetical protein BD626DRAFT_534686, partial [Schizophyllum amplum]